MTSEKIIESTAKTLATVDVGGKKTDQELAALDRGILRVALMISGLDGIILPVEYAAFGEMAKRCRGATAKNVRALYDAAIVKAGQLAGMAQAGVYSEADRLAAFVRMAMEALPKGFDRGSLADLRRAFALWIAMGVSDGAFTGFERKAVQTLVRRFALMRAARTKKFAALIEPDFFAKAEKIVADMGTASKRAKAEAALAALVANVEVKDKGGTRVYRPASGIAFSSFGSGPMIPGWR